MSEHAFDFKDFCNAASTLGSRWTDEIYEECGILPCACFDKECPLETVYDVRGLIGNIMSELRPDLEGQVGGIALSVLEVQAIRMAFWTGCKLRIDQLVKQGASRMICNEVAARFGIHE